MGSFILRGILIGILFGMPAGAVGAMTAQRTLNYGMKAGLLTGLGSSVADCFYASVGAFGLTLISEFLLRYQSVIYLLGGCFILGMGIQLLRRKNSEVTNPMNATGNMRMFFSSFVVGITNPAAILTFLFAFSWFGISGQTGIKEGVGLVGGVFVGTYIWWGTLSGVVTIFKKRAKSQHLQRMNRIFGIVLMLFGVTVLLLSACGNKEDPKEKAEEVKASSEEREESVDVETGGDAQMQEIIIEVGGQSFWATVYDNNTVRALTQRLPMTLSMDEMNGNEKFYYMPDGLPTDAQNVGSIKTGDILLYGSDCLVLFFEDFDTSYSYTRIGHIEDAKAFAKALSGGTVEVSFRAGE